MNEDEDGYVSDDDKTESDRRRNRKDGGGGGALKRIKMARELSDLVNHCQSVRFKDFKTSAAKRKLDSCSAVKPLLVHALKQIHYSRYSFFR